MSETQKNQVPDDPEWQKDVLTKLLFASLDEQKKTRKWNMVFKVLLLLYLLLVLLAMLIPGGAKKALPRGDHTALIEIKGVISADSEANADSIVTGLRKAFENEHVKGIVLRINSPGGSPVQSAYINDEIKRLREKHTDKKVYAVIVDLCASGGYYIASAADEIYADKGSLVGSIGVIMNGFGFVEAIDKLGIERRLYTAGDNKAFLDPFLPKKQEETDHIQGVLAQVHQQFIDVVKKGRGDKLKDDKKLFSGFVWTGEEGVRLGLVDALGSSSYVAREIIKAEEIVDYTPKPNLLEQLVDRFGVKVANSLISSLSQNNMSLQ